MNDMEKKYQVIDIYGDPIPGIEVVIGPRSDQRGTITDMNGFFILNEPENTTILLTHLAFKNREFKVRGMPRVITLEEDVITTKPVTVIARKFKYPQRSFK